MPIVKRTLTFVRGFLLSYGPSNVKKMFWDREFTGTKWDFIDNTQGDCVYAHLEKYSQNGDLLDLGCGPGNTANELAETAYKTYTGVDISDAALAKAVRRTQETGRTAKNVFVRSDFLGYEPTRAFDVILFRESMYHVPYGKVRPILDKYSKHLKPGGVFMVRLFPVQIETGKLKYRVTRKINLIKREFDVVESTEYSDMPGRPTVLVFRARRRN
jgi:SAM-dependent methyltransferase